MCPRPLPPLGGLPKVGPEGGDDDDDECASSGRGEDGGAGGVMRRNVQVAYAFTLVAGLARGVWSYSVLSGYLYVLTSNSNFLVGLAEGAQGIAQAVVSLGAGWAADRFRRDAVCRAAAGLGVCASAGLALAVSLPDLDEKRRFVALVCGLGSFGAYQGVWNTALETIFADSTKRGEKRAAATTRKFGLTLVATCAGPLVAIALFLWLGDDWTLKQLRTVMLVGVCLCGPPALLLLLLRDVREEDDDDDDRGMSPSTEPPLINGDDGEPAVLKPRGSRLGPVPYVVLASDLLSGFGSGMTVKFVPLFFKNRVGFSPVGANCLYVASPVFMFLGSRGCGWLSKNALGRPRACAYFMAVAALGLVGLSLLDAGDAGDLATFLDVSRMQAGAGGSSNARSPEAEAAGGSGQLRPLRPLVKKCAAVGLYLVTNAQHMCRPLKKSALMDHVPYASRGKWNAVDGVTRFGWSGSAVLGGYLVDRGGYSLTFVITALMQLLAAALWLSLVGVVDPHAPGWRALCDAKVDDDDDDDGGAGAAVDDADAAAPADETDLDAGRLDAPLLAPPRSSPAARTRQAPGSPRHKSYEEHLRTDSHDSSSYLSDYSEMPV